MRDPSCLIGRRAVLGMIGACAVRAAAPESPLRFTALDHVEISVPDALKSATFYALVFGGPIWKNNKTVRRYVKFGSRYISIEQREPYGVDHFSVGIEGFRIEDIHAFLNGRGVEWKDYPSGKDLNVTDPDGIHLQLSADNTWSDMQGRTASIDGEQGLPAPIFGPTGIDHILLNVADPERSAVFYEKIFGPVSERSNSRIWFRVGKSRVGLLKAPAGERPGVNHFCVSAGGFDYESAVKKLEAMNARVQPSEGPGSPMFRDLDGLLLQVNKTQ